MSQALPYRPDIDTLRAAAVLSVIVFHIEKNWLPGGFLGVDIFFVISGFLMTMILHREMSGGGRFSLKAFYIRRIKRILPAFFAVLAATLTGGFFLFTKDDFFLLWKSALTALGFASNLYFARGKDYFDPAQEEKPLLHIFFVGRRTILLCLSDIAAACRPQKPARTVRLPRRIVRLKPCRFLYAFRVR